jgi:hypothetical protein
MSPGTSTLSSRILRLPYTLLQQILIKLEDVTTVLWFAQVSKACYQTVLTDHVLWRILYTRKHRQIAIEKIWLETFIYQLQRAGSLKNLAVTLDKRIQTLWNNIDWYLALKHRTLTENNWRKCRPVRVIRSEQLDALSSHNGAETSYLPMSPDMSGILLQHQANRPIILHASNLQCVKYLDGFCSYHEKDIVRGKDHFITRIVGQHISLTGLGDDIDSSISYGTAYIWFLEEPGVHIVLDNMICTDVSLHGLWAVYTRNSVYDEDAICPDVELYIQSLSNHIRFIFNICSGTYWTVQDQTDHSLLLHLVTKDVAGESPMMFERIRIKHGGKDQLLLERSRVKTVLTEIDYEIRRLHYVHDGYVVFVGLCLDNVWAKKVYIAKYNINEQHCESYTTPTFLDVLVDEHTDDLTMEVVWSVELEDYEIFPEFGYLIGCTSRHTWCLFKISTGECVRFYHLEIDLIAKRLLGPFCLCKTGTRSSLVDMFTGQIICSWERNYDLPQHAGMTYSVDLLSRKDMRFLIMDYNSLLVNTVC